MTLITYTNPSGVSVTFGPGTVFGITSVDGLDAPDSDSQAQKAPYQDGDTWIDELFQTREVTVEGWILIPQNLDAIAVQRRVLESIINAKQGPGTLLVNKDGFAFKLTAQPSPGPKFKWKSGKNPWQGYSVNWICHDPYFYDPTPTVNTFTISVPLFVMPVGVGWAWPVAGARFSSVSTQSVLVCNNTGDVVTPVVFTLTGPATNPKVTNQATNEFLKFSVTLAAGDYITCSTAFGAKTVTLVTAGVPTNGMGKLANGSTFWSLAQGANSIKFSDDSGSTTAVLSLTFSNRYIGM